MPTGRKPDPPPASSWAAQPAHERGETPERFCEVVAPRRPRFTKESKVRAATIAILALAAFVAIGRKADWRPPGSVTAALAPAAPRAEPKPQEVIYRMLYAAGQGDAAAYLDCYRGELLRRLEQSRNEMTPAGFAQYLAQTNRQIKGIAISEPAASSQTQVELRVEYVYQDRNEAQQFFLENFAGEWKIARVSTAERVDTLVPYGTPVY